MVRSFILGVLACACAAGTAAAQASAGVQATGSAVILDPAMIGQGASLSVPSVARPASGSTTATAASASYTIVGQGGESFTVSMPSSLKLVRAGGTEEVTLTLKPTRSSGAFAGAKGQVSATTIGVDGAVPVSSTTATGTYEGQFGVTLDYQ